MMFDKNCKRVELCLINGKKVLRTFSLKKIYNVEERRRYVVEFMCKFPFVKISKVPYVHFRYMTIDDDITFSDDAAYNVNCNLIEFCKLLDISYSSFAEAKLRTAIEEG